MTSAELEKSVVLPTPQGLSQPQEMTFLEHLDELRGCVVISVISLVVAMGASFFIAVPVIEWLKAVAPKGVTFVQIAPGEVFMCTFRISFFLGIALALPVVLYQLLKFILPGLNTTEKRWLFGIVLGGAGLFAGGIVFGYYAVLPSTLDWLLGFEVQVAANQMSIGRFIEFCSSVLLITGVMFELPVLLFFLSFTRLVTSQKMIRQWRWATVGIFLAAAVITPSQDPITMTIVGLAMVALYFLTLIPMRLVGR